MTGPRFHGKEQKWGLKPVLHHGSASNSRCSRQVTDSDSGGVTASWEDDVKTINVFSMGPVNEAGALVFIFSSLSPFCSVRD